MWRCRAIASVFTALAVSAHPTPALGEQTSKRVAEVIAAHAQTNPYAGPTLREPPPEDQDPKDALAAIRLWYAETIRGQTETFRQTLSKVSPESYNRFLSSRKATAERCAGALPEPLADAVVAFFDARDAQGEQEAIRAARRSTEARPELAECVDALMSKVDGRGILIAGLILGKTAQGKSALKPAIANPGLVFVIEPQVLTAWPGRQDSAVAVLDPREGPWKARLAHTYEDKVEAHSQQWKRKETIAVKDYLSATNNGHFLLETDKGTVLGWVDMDQSAFFQAGWELSPETVDFYRSGCAAFKHGAWWNPAGTVWNPRTMEAVQGNVDLYDFLALVAGRIRGSGQRSPTAPYPQAMELSRIAGASAQPSTIPGMPLRMTFLSVKNPAGTMPVERGLAQVSFSPAETGKPAVLVEGGYAFSLGETPPRQINRPGYRKSPLPQTVAR